MRGVVVVACNFQFKTVNERKLNACSSSLTKNAIKSLSKDSLLGVLACRADLGEKLLSSCGGLPLPGTYAFCFFFSFVKNP